MQRDSTSTIFQKIQPSKLLLSSACLLISNLPGAAAFKDEDTGTLVGFLMAAAGFIIVCGRLVNYCCRDAEEATVITCPAPQPGYVPLASNPTNASAPDIVITMR